MSRQSYLVACAFAVLALQIISSTLVLHYERAQQRRFAMLEKRIAAVEDIKWANSRKDAWSKNELFESPRAEVVLMRTTAISELDGVYANVSHVSKDKTVFSKEPDTAGLKPSTTQPSVIHQNSSHPSHVPFVPFGTWSGANACPLPRGIAW